MPTMLTQPTDNFFFLHEQFADETGASRGFIAQEPHMRRLINLIKKGNSKTPTQMPLAN